MIAIPSSVFAVPSADDINNNPLYWQGYSAGASQVERGLVAFPNLSKYNDYWSYWAAVQASLPPASPWDANAVGENCAKRDAANYLFINDPTSPHNRVVN